MSLIVVFSIDFLGDEFNIIVEAEDAGDEQEGLGNIDQQTVRHVVNHNDLIRHQRNAAHDEQPLLFTIDNRTIAARMICL